MIQRYEFSFEQEEARNGLHLFWYCHSLALSCGQRFRGQALLPSGARIFYYTRRLLLGKGVRPAVNPNEEVLPVLVVERFLASAPTVAERLALDFSRALEVRAELPRLERIVVAPVARPQDHPQLALRLLCDRLARDTAFGWDVPSSEEYHYDEPLNEWLLRLLAR